MKAFILYHPEAEFSRSIEAYAKEFAQLRNKQIELISLETRRGADMAELYGIMQFPAVVAIRENGELLKEWQSNQLPLMNEVSGYLD